MKKVQDLECNALNNSMPKGKNSPGWTVFNPPWTIYVAVQVSLLLMCEGLDF